MKVLRQILLVIALMPVMANAVAPVGRQVTATITLQGGSDSNAKWTAPLTAAYKVNVFVPKTGTTTNALYRVYPKSKRAGSTKCLDTDAQYPCYEATIDQTLYPNAWTQLMLNDDPATQWDFVKGIGYVTAVASNLSAAKLLNLSALVRFENQVFAIGKTYQGGIVFYVDNTGEHGLVAASTDQSTGIQWYNGSYPATGATATAVGTGLTNTTKIIKAQGLGSYAAKLCTDLVIGAYSDWYLPSIDELSLMYYNIGPGAAAPLTNVAGFAFSAYWSSSETKSDAYRAWYIGFGGSVPKDNDKNNIKYVRAVRAF